MEKTRTRKVKKKTLVAPEIPPIIKTVRLHPKAVIPSIATKGSAGFDLVAVEDMRLSRQEARLIPLGFKTAIPEGYHFEVYPRSGLAIKYKINLINNVGIIDSDYREEWMVPLFNAGITRYMIMAGDRIAQAILKKTQPAHFALVDELPESEREGGFGSTGR